MLILLLLVGNWFHEPVDQAFAWSNVVVELFHQKVQQDAGLGEVPTNHIPEKNGGLGVQHGVWSL